MVYRSDIEALEARYRALDAELAERTRARDEAAQLLAEARARARDDVRMADLAAGGPARRRRWRRSAAMAVLAALVVMGIVGQRTASHQRAAGVQRMLDRYGELADKICACADRACVDKVTEELTSWAAQLSHDHLSARLDEPTLHRATEVARRMSDCMIKASSPRPTPGAPRVTNWQ
ncbi:MAG TPA: hypothetical protein VGD37_44050 [Kofleriaceae bacterium]|jgi:hypothetical protein